MVSALLKARGHKFTRSVIITRVVHNYAFNWDMFAEAILDNQGVCIQGRYVNHLYFICPDSRSIRVT
jgi:hypothetical protein